MMILSFRASTGVLTRGISMRASALNTLRYEPEQCINCGMCSAVCPHGVFAPDGSTARLVQPESCMECGACQLNCPTGAIVVDSGVGCATAMILAALTGKKEPTCAAVKNTWTDGRGSGYKGEMPKG